jgi:tetratricopeptide (TPR) repeat protein
MRCVIIFLLFVSLMSGCSSCGRSAANSEEQTDTNASSESPFANITDAREALAEGNRLLDEDDTEMAIAAFKRAVEIDPDLADAWFQLGIGYALREMQESRLGDTSEQPANSKERVKRNSEKAFEKAVDAYKKWLKENPNDDAAEFNLGRTYAKLNRDEEAEEAFKQAVKLKPDDTEYLTELGAILIKLARYSEAIDPLKKAVALDDTNSRAQDLLEDAEAGRQRLSYVAPANANLSNANKSANANVSASAANSNSNSNTARKAPAANTRPKTEETKRKPTPEDEDN